MKCPECKHDDNEVRRKDYEKSFMMKSNIRERYCNRCGYYWQTEEVVASEPYRKRDRERVYKRDINQKDLDF